MTQHSKDHFDRPQAAHVIITDPLGKFHDQHGSLWPPFGGSLWPPLDIAGLGGQ